MSVHIGCSGWQYRDWRGAFYPDEIAQKQWLAHYSEHFATVEVNNSFYRLPEATTFEKWAAGTPQDFIIAVKASRYLTHIKRLKDPAEPVERFSERARALGSKLGPVLLQLPPTLKRDTASLDDTLSRFDRRTFRLAVEFRHDSWFTDEVLDVLARYDAIFVLADKGSRPVTPIERTAEAGYVRLHAGRAEPHPCYGRAALESWAERIASTYGRRADVYVYLNNDTNACAPRDAGLLARACRINGLSVTRVPEPGAVTVG